jgi:hypothetical protein
MIRPLTLALLVPMAAAAQDPAMIDAAAAPFFAPGTYGDPFADTGLSQGCQPDGGGVVCTITSRGVNLIARSANSAEAAISLLQVLPVNTAVAFTGDITSMGDITAEFALSSIQIGDADPYADVLAMLQGDWVSVDDPAYTMVIDGTQQIESYGDEVQGAYLISLQDQCPEVGGNDPDGPDGTGPVLLAELMGGDPMTDIYCYALLTTTAADLQMSLIGGNGSTLAFARP